MRQPLSAVPTAAAMGAGEHRARRRAPQHAGTCYVAINADTSAIPDLSILTDCFSTSIATALRLGGERAPEARADVPVEASQSTPMRRCPPSDQTGQPSTAVATSGGMVTVRSLRPVGPPNDPTAAQHRVWLPTDVPQGLSPLSATGAVE